MSMDTGVGMLGLGEFLVSELGGKLVSAANETPSGEERRGEEMRGRLMDVPSAIMLGSAAAMQEQQCYLNPFTWSNVAILFSSEKRSLISR